MHKKNKRICHLTTVHAYSDTRIFHKECVSLAKRGYEVILLATVPQSFREKNVRIVALGETRNRIHRLFVKTPKAIFVALRVKANIYHLHDPELLLAVPFLKLRGAIVIYDIHEDYYTSIKQKQHMPTLIRLMIARPFSFIERFVGRMCHQIIAEKYYERRFPEATKILNYPQFFQNKAEVAVRAFDSNYSWFLYTGNVAISRGAFSQLRLLVVNPSTAIACIGYCPEEIAKKMYKFMEDNGICKDRLVIIGVGSFVPRSTIDGYTQMSHWKAGLALFPKTPHYAEKELTKFFEYMQSGVPVFCTDFPTWKKLIEGSGAGICVDTNSDNDLKRSVENFLDPRNAERIRRYGEAGRRAVESQYNWASQEQELYKLYDELLN